MNKKFSRKKRCLSYLSLTVGEHNIYEKENLRRVFKKGKWCLSFDSHCLKRGDGYFTVQVWLQAQRHDLPSKQSSYFHCYYIIIQRFLFLLTLACSSRAAMLYKENCCNGCPMRSPDADVVCCPSR